MNLTKVINILNSNLNRNGNVWESSAHRFKIIDQDQKCLWVNMDKLNGSDKDVRCDYNNTIQIKTIKELKERIESDQLQEELVNLENLFPELSPAEEGYMNEYTYKTYKAARERIKEIKSLKGDS